MKNKGLKTLNLILFIVAVLVVIGQAFAWFAVDRMGTDLGFGGSSTSAYFAGGTGKLGDPYRITTAQHMYNLAWLQDKGLLQDSQNGSTTFYFKLDNDIDMDGMVLPPIGTADHPFNSVFNGGGYTIANLNISTDVDVLTNAADKTITFSNYVGMFGATGTNSNILNFILLDPKVEVASVNSSSGNSVNYASSESTITYNGRSYYAVGIAIGDVQGKASTIGVKTSSARTTGQLSVKQSGYMTYNSILGSVNTKDVFVTGNTSVSGDGNQFGSSFNVQGMITRLRAIYKNQYGVEFASNNTQTGTTGLASTYSIFLPLISTGNSNPTLAADEKLPFSVTDDSTYETTTSGNVITYAKEVVSAQNVGYFLGNQVKFSTKTYKFQTVATENNGTYTVAKLTSAPTNNSVPNWFYSYRYYVDGSTPSYNLIEANPTYTSSFLTPLSSDEFNSLPQTVKDLLPTGNSNSMTYQPVRVSQDFKNQTSPYFTTGNDGWTLHGQISWNGQVYGEGFRHKDGYTVDENGNYLGGSLDSYVKGIFLPNNAIWVKPTQKGKMRFVMLAENDGDSFALIKITRTKATAENPFYTPLNDNNWGSYSDIVFEETIKATLPANVLIYYEIDVTQEVEAGNVEYMILRYNNTGSESHNGAYFLYIDIGASGNNNAQTPTEGEYSVEADVSAVDFLYDGVTISEGNFVFGGTLYKVTGSRVYFTFTSSAAIYLDFRRSGANYFTVTVNKGYTNSVIRVTSEAVDSATFSLAESNDIRFAFATQS
jgi:hypothetical protein